MAVAQRLAARMRAAAWVRNRLLRGYPDPDCGCGVAVWLSCGCGCGVAACYCMTFPETAARMPKLGIRSPERSVSSHGVAVAAAGTGSLLQRTQWLALADPAWLRCAGRWRLPACLRRDARAHRVLRQRGPARGTAGHPSHGGEGQPCQQPPRCGAGSGPAAAAEPVSIAVAHVQPPRPCWHRTCTPARVYTCTHSHACSCTRAHMHTYAPAHMHTCS